MKWIISFFKQLFACWKQLVSCVTSFRSLNSVTNFTWSFLKDGSPSTTASWSPGRNSCQKSCAKKWDYFYPKRQKCCCASQLHMKSADDISNHGTIIGESTDNCYIKYVPCISTCPNSLHYRHIAYCNYVKSLGSFSN